jgi:hypothetical protein
MANPDIEHVLTELAATAQYLQESGRLMREAVNHLIESEERIVKVNRNMGLIVERVENAITAALRAADHGGA